MSYGRNFGMRSFENLVRVGRHKNAAVLPMGAAVVVDATTGDLVAAAAGAAPTALSGLVAYEHISNISDALTLYDDAPYDQVPAGQYAQMLQGKGAKVWFANTASKTLYDGRTRAAVTRVDTTGLAVGDGLMPAANGNWTKATSAAVTWLVVEQINTTTGRVEARFTF